METVQHLTSPHSMCSRNETALTGISAISTPGTATGPCSGLGTNTGMLLRGGDGQDVLLRALPHGDHAGKDTHQPQHQSKADEQVILCLIFKQLG